MSNRLASSPYLAFLVAGVSACASNQESTELGIALLTTTSTPADVQCLSLTAIGATTVVRDFDVVPNQPVTLTAPGLPIGSVTLSESAYNVPCSQVTLATLPTWVTDPPVVVQLQPDYAVPVNIVLRRPGQVVITNVFDDNSDGGVGPDGGKQDGASDGIRDGVNDGIRDGINDGIRDGINDGIRDGISDGIRDGINDGIRDGINDGIRDGINDGIRDGISDGIRDGINDGKRD